MVRVAFGVVGLGLLGCAGLGGGAEDATTDEAVADGPDGEGEGEGEGEGDDGGDAEEDDAGGAEGPNRVFALHPTDKGCAWKVWTPDGKDRVLATTPSCPTQILWNPDGTEVIYVTSEGMFAGPWRKKGAEKIRLPTWSTDGWLDPWIAKDSGRLRNVALVPAKVEERDGKLLFVAGELSIPVKKDAEGWVTYGVKGTEVVAPGAGDRDVSLPDWGLPYVAVFVERGDDGKWTRLAAFPTMSEAGDTPGPDVGGSLQHEADWPSLSGMDLYCGGGQDCMPDAMQEREDLKKLLALEEEDSVGWLPGDPGGAAFKVIFGDSPHAAPPVFTCPDADCKEPVALKGLDGLDQLTVQPRGRYVLVAKEYGGEGPRLYEQGKAEPVLTLPDAVRSGWVPEKGLPRPPREPKR